MKKIRLLLLLIPIVFVTLLTGCVGLHREVQIGANGFSTVLAKVQVSSKMIALSGKSAEDFFAGYQTQSTVLTDSKLVEENINGEKWYSAIYSVTLPTKMLGDMIDASMGDGVQTKVTQTGFIKKTITIEASHIGNVASSFEEYSEQYSSYATLIGSMGISDDFTIITPYKITSTNGIIDGDNNRKVTWNMYDFDVNKTKSKTMTVTYIDYTIIIIIVASIAMILTIIIVIVVTTSITKSIENKKREKIAQKQQQMLAYNEKLFREGKINPIDYQRKKDEIMMQKYF